MKIATKVIYLVLLLCLGQQTFGQMNDNLNKKQMEKFDINKLNRFKAENKREDTLTDGSTVAYFENSAEIQETTKEPDSGYSIVKQYFKSNLSLKREEHFFYGMPIGKMKEYDHSGNLIQELNYETIFKFSIEDLEKYLLKNYKIDIFKDKSFGVLRHFLGIQTPYYQIYIQNGIDIHIIILNGITGELMSETNTTLEK